MTATRQTLVLIAGVAVGAILMGCESARMFADGLWGASAHSGWSADAQILLVWAIGHCDTLDGPLVKLARKALEVGNVNLVLPWVPPTDETEVKHAFQHAAAVRKLGSQARELADHHFLETLVRIHRAGEGAPYTGLKPAGTDLGPAVPAADNALVDGSIDKVIELLVNAVRNGARKHFQEAWNRRKFDVDDVASGREYVEAYVPYIHYVERLWVDATTGAHGHYPEEAPHAHTAHHAHEH